MMDTKENRDASCSSQLKQLTEENTTGESVPTLRDRMRQLMQLRSAWDSEDSTVSPLHPRHDRGLAPPRQSLNPDSGQVNHMKAKFARLAEELRLRADDEECPPKKPQPALSSQAAAKAELERRKRRWTPPKSTSPAPPRPGSPNLRSRSPSPSRAEMPNSPRGGASGTVERPKPTPVSARKASWEEQIASANETTRMKSRANKPPVPPRTPLSSLKSKALPETPVMASNRSESSCRKESVRKNRCRQNDMKYEAGLAAVGFEVTSETTEIQPAVSVVRERSLKRKSEDSRRPVHSSLLRIISQSNSAEMDSVAEKKARMLNLMTPSSFNNPHDPEMTPSSFYNPLDPDRTEARSTLDSELTETRTDSEVTFSDNNSLFADEDEETAGHPRLNTFMEDMWRAERRASLGEETMTEVTTEENTESDFDVEEEEEQMEQQQQPDEEEEMEQQQQPDEEEERSEDTSSVQVEVASTTGDISPDVTIPDVSATDLSAAQDVAEQHDESTRRKFLQFMEQREKTTTGERVTARPQPSPRPQRRGRRSSSMSDLSSPLLLRPTTLERPQRNSKACLAYTVENYRSTVIEGRLSPPAPRVYSMEFSDLETDGEATVEVPERRERLVMGVASRLDAKRIGSYEQQAAQQEEVIYQASKALHQVMANGRTGSAQHIECSRVLVVACQKRQALLEESSRLRQGISTALNPSSACCVLTLSGVRLVLKADYRQRIQAQQQLLQTGLETAVEQHYFLCLLKLPGGRVHATEMTATGTNMGPSARDFIEIPSCLTLKDLPQGFVARLEVYGLSLSRVENRTGRSPSKERTPRKLLRRLRGGRAGQGREGPAGVSPGAWTAHTGFSLLSSVRLTPESVGQSVFPLLRLPALSPLEGIVQLRLRVTSEPRIERRGFVSIFAEVGGFGSWLRRWCSLRRDWLLMWNYPDEESAGVPAHLSFSLRQCVTRRVELLTKEECARPFTMRLHLLRNAREGESDNLVITRQGDLVLEKFLLSAESRQEQMEWADSLNDCLFMMRQFHADQFRALEARAQGFLNV